MPIETSSPQGVTQNAGGPADSGVFMPNPQSDALVVFGVTGDLAYKKIIPSIYHLARRGRLAGPVLGVAREQWSLQRLRERISASVRAHESDVDDAALAALCERLRIVGGDYRD